MIWERCWEYMKMKRKTKPDSDPKSAKPEEDEEEEEEKCTCTGWKENVKNKTLENGQGDENLEAL